jgi:hypothetical protein
MHDDLHLETEGLSENYPRHILSVDRAGRAGAQARDTRRDSVLARRAKPPRPRAPAMWSDRPERGYPNSEQFHLANLEPKCRQRGDALISCTCCDDDARSASAISGLRHRSKERLIRLPRRHATKAMCVRGSHVEHRFDMHSRSSDIRLVRLPDFTGKSEGDAGRKQSEPVSTSVLIVPAPGVEQRRPVH